MDFSTPTHLGRPSRLSTLEHWSRELANGGTLGQLFDWRKLFLNFKSIPTGGRALAAAVLDDAPYPTHPADSIANMQVIDAVYQKAGLRLRGGV